MKYITKKFLRNNPDTIFVFGDNLQRKGLGGAAKLRNEPNTYGFITKKAPNNNWSSFYKPDDYKFVYMAEMLKLVSLIESSRDKTFYISKLGSGLANKHNIYESIIKKGLTLLEKHDNVVLMKG